jgi:hypothetical protein
MGMHPHPWLAPRRADYASGYALKKTSYLGVFCAKVVV